jgi:hypothetical protein
MRNYEKLIESGNKAQMEKLRENEHKRGFDNLDVRYSNRRIKEEQQELDHAIAIGDLEAIRREAADIANFAHMIIYRCDSILEN